MKQHVLLVVALSIAMVSPAPAKGPEKSREVEIRFADPYPTPSLFGKVIIISRSGLRHELLVRNGDEPYEGGKPDAFELSPHGQYVVLQTQRHERPGCVFADTDTGEIVGRGNWGQCAGTFTRENVWRSIDGNEVVLQRRW